MTVNEPVDAETEATDLLCPEQFFVGAEMTFNGITGVITAVNDEIFIWYVEDHGEDYTFPRPRKGDLWMIEPADSQ